MGNNHGEFRVAAILIVELSINYDPHTRLNIRRKAHGGHVDFAVVRVVAVRASVSSSAASSVPMGAGASQKYIPLFVPQ